MYFFLLVIISKVFGGVDVPIVIDREFVRQIDPADFLIDYDAEKPPNTSMKVNVIVDIKYFKWKYIASPTLCIEITQSWQDHRLTIPQDISIYVPREKKIWSPDTYIENALSTVWEPEYSRRLNFGVVYEKRRLKGFCRETVLVLGSFDNAAVKMIDYNVTQILYPSDYTNDTSIWTVQSQIVVSPNGQILKRAIIHFTQALDE